MTQPPPEQPGPGEDRPPPGQPPQYGQPPSPGQPGDPSQGWYQYGQYQYGQYQHPYPHPGQFPGYPPYGAGWLDPADPLVNPPGVGIGGWANRIVTTLGRSWRLLLQIMLLTQVVPGLAIGVLGLAAGGFGGSVVPGPTGTGRGVREPTVEAGLLVGLVIAILVITVLTTFVSSIGWAAGTWAAAREAAGERVTLGNSLRYGLSRALGLWGWSLLIGLIIVAGICACVLPGIYLAFALSLAGPVYLFERQNPIGRSFRIFHSELGMVLGRVALLALVVIVSSLVIEAVPQGVGALFGVGTTFTAGAVVVTVVSTVLSVPIYAVQLVGLMATYAETRGREGPVDTRRLVAELG